MRISFSLNQKPIIIDAPSGKLLQDILRDLDVPAGEEFLHSPGCKRGRCGRCLVLLNNKVRHSCLIPGFALRGKEVTTIEGFRTSKGYSIIEGAFKEAGYSPCQLCFSSRILITSALLEKYTTPTDAHILEGFEAIECDCSGYDAFARAVKTASRRRRQYG